MADPTIAIGYLRVSTDADTQALGLAAQRSAIVEWASREGVTVAAWHVDTVSGGASLAERPGLLAALAALDTLGAGRLVVSRLDRFSRDPLAAALAEAEIRRSGAVLSVAEGGGAGDDPTSRLVRGILISVAEFERALIRARISAALAAKKAKGEHVGGAPYGWRVRRVDGRTATVPDPSEQATISTLRALQAEGLTYRQIIPRATAMGLLSRAGTPLTVCALSRILSRETQAPALAAE